MAEPGDTRVAVYIDFDNIVISRYDQIHGRSQFARDKARAFGAADREADPELAEKMAEGTVDIGAVIDFASSFGTLVLTRAYADWSAPVNADYRGQLVGRAVDLVQLFPAAAYAKNGADIRLAVDAVEDMFRLPDLTHVVIVAGDSDYIALAQRCKRLGRYVVGIGVAGSTSKSLAAACDEFVIYDALPGVTAVAPAPSKGRQAKNARASSDAGTDASGATGVSEDAGTQADPVLPERKIRNSKTAAVSASTSATAGKNGKSRPVTSATRGGAPGSGRRGSSESGLDAELDDTDYAHDTEDEDDADTEDPQAGATSLLERALRLGQEKDDAEWLHSSAVKSQMKRMDPSFSERSLGYRSFSDFVKSRDTVAELDESTMARLVRLAPTFNDGR